MFIKVKRPGADDFVLLNAAHVVSVLPDGVGDGGRPLVRVHMAQGSPVTVYGTVDDFLPPGKAVAPGECPVCGAAGDDDMKYGDLGFEDDAAVNQTVTCRRCSARWVDHFTLTGQVIVRQG